MKAFLKSLAVITVVFISFQPVNSVAKNAKDANGKYNTLLQTIHCPSDVSSYGNFRDYGYWAGGSWCGKTGVAGYWVWVNPNWYVWEYSR